MATPRPTSLVHRLPRRTTRATAERSWASGLFALMSFVLIAGLAMGCDIIWEPPERAAERLMKATENRDRRTIGEYFENDALEKKMRRLSSAFDGPLYEGLDGSPWRLNGIEEDDSNGYTYVWVDIDIPSGSSRFSNSVTTTDIVLEMDRDFLSWEVLDVQGIDDVLSRLDRARR